MKEKVKYILGSLLITIRPKKAAALAKKGMTILMNQKLTLSEHLMRNALLKKADKNQEFETLSEYHRNYWVNKGRDLFARTDDMFENFFLPDWSFIFDILKDELATTPNKFNTLVEIGAGNGNVLEYLESQFPQIERLVGIDLSEEQIILNKKKFLEKPKLDFVAADGYDWVKSYGQENTIFVTSGGVLEYFTQDSLQDFLRLLNGLGNIIFVAIEPIGIEVDFEKNPNSQTYGQERSFSHNYQALFKQAGFKLWHKSEKRYPDCDWFFTFIGAKN